MQVSVKVRYAFGSFITGNSAMSIWGKLADVAAELARGDPIGALRSGVGHQEQNGSALGAKMAKADGIVTDDEINAFKEVFKVPPGARPDPRHADDAD